LPFVKCTFHTYSMLLKFFFFFALLTSQYRLYRAYHAYRMLQRQLSHLNGRKFDHRPPTYISITTAI
jgi:hypothetical protein